MPTNILLFCHANIYQSFSCRFYKYSLLELSYYNGYQNMQSLSYRQIQQKFRRIDVSDQDFFKYEQLRGLMSKINQGQFDEDVHHQLWQQCTQNSAGKVKLSEYISYILKAQAILKKNQQQANQKLYIIEAKLKEPHSNFTNPQNIRQMQTQILQIKQAKLQYQTDLQILQRPFKLVMQSLLYVQKEHQHSKDDENMNLNQQQNSYILVWILYTTIIMLGLSALILLYLPMFHNLVLFCFIMCIFLYKHFNFKIIRFLLLATIGSILIDIFWIIIKLKYTWQPAPVGNQAQYLTGYLKACVIFTFFILIGKILVSVLLTMGLKLNENKKYAVKTCFSNFEVTSKYKDTYPLLLQFPNKVNDI